MFLSNIPWKRQIVLEPLRARIGPALPRSGVDADGDLLFGRLAVLIPLGLLLLTTA
jgi:hypothetical protein